MYGRIRAILAEWAKRPGLRRVGFSLALNSVEVFLSIAFLASGIPILIDPSAVAPDSVLALLPLPFVYSWATGLVVGGVLKILGIITVQERVERIGALSLGVTMGVYSAALVALLPNSMVSLFICVACSLAMIARFWVLGRLLDARRTLEGG